MHTATATLKSISPYSQSKHITEAKLERETGADYEKRCWRERLHVDEEGYVFIPPMAFKNNLAEAAKFLSIQIPGKGKATYTKHFEAGVLVTDGPRLPLRKEDVKGEWLFLPSDGIRGSGKRVDKCYPVIPSWQAEVVYHVLDDAITQEVFTYHLQQAGKFIGIGRFRPRNNGYYGRYDVLKVDWV